MGHCEPLAGLSEALHHTVHHTEPGLKRLAERLGIRPGYLADAANPDREELQFQLRLLLPLTKLTGDVSVLDYMEQECGRIAVPMPRVDQAGRELLALQLHAVKEFGEQAEAIAQALEDGRIDVDERRRICKELDDVSRAIAAVKAHVELVASGGPRAVQEKTAWVGP